MDKAKNIWIINDKDELILVDKNNMKVKTFLPYASSTGNTTDQLYDLGVLEDQLYLFYRSGLLICYNLKSHQEIYRQSYRMNFLKGIRNTSYVVPGNNTFYQFA